MRNANIIFYIHHLNPDFDRQLVAEMLGVTLKYVDLVLTLIKWDDQFVPLEDGGLLGAN